MAVSYFKAQNMEFIKIARFDSSVIFVIVYIQNTKIICMSQQRCMGVGGLCKRLKSTLDISKFSLLLSQSKFSGPRKFTFR